ncbi:hypothetical protein [Yoonia sp. 208BN28-4]|uniref:hypothetical protein n=1 Tax=Yoonia sp. 208BN28-4 TaxID=3126505 RepID=UPI0030AB560D
MILRLAALFGCAALPATAYDLQETCEIVKTCQYAQPCQSGGDAFEILTTFASDDAADEYVIVWRGQQITDAQINEGHIFSWLTDVNDDPRSFALSYIYNSKMPNPDVAEFLLMETAIQGRLTDTFVHSGQCRESE